MSAQMTPSEDAVNIEVNGKPCSARKGQMIIEITDAQDVDVPRFCYHSKLPIAANCRMCLVQVEMGGRLVPKPLPACATPVAEGMKIWTDSDYARNAQKAVMEFLLINHPLDCPICDQGGECELQDVAMGYGRDVSRFAERKRVVRDEDIGPLIATDMTRCIHCTRCVRFLEHIAGHKELGATGRGENTHIGVYIEHALESELSGNVIDVCPVGALTSKPFRFRARAWELTQHAGISPHDCVGSNLSYHSRRGEVMRVVPGVNEAINEVWLADRDRFSYAGANSDDRLRTPWARQDGEWQAVSWEAALDSARGLLKKYRGDDLGILVHPSCTVEEMYLANRLAEHLGCSHIDHRLRRCDFTDQDRLPLFPWLGQSIASLADNDAVLLIGANPRKQQPIIGHRLRQAALAGASIMAINPYDHTQSHPLTHRAIATPAGMLDELAGIAAYLLGSDTPPTELATLINDREPSATQVQIGETLRSARRPLLLLGLTAFAHPALSALRALAGVIAEASGATIGYLSEGANGAGATLAGVLPHRTAAGSNRAQRGLDAHAMLARPRRAYLLIGSIEPEFDCADPALARQALAQAEAVIALSAFDSDGLNELADLVLPITPPTETSGTYINCEGRWQSFAAAVPPQGDARPGWKVLRVLGNLLGAERFEYLSSEEVRDELRNRVGERTPDRTVPRGAVRLLTRAAAPRLARIGELGPYQCDALVRRAAALQATPDADIQQLRLHPEDIDRLGLGGADQVLCSQGDAELALALIADPRVPPGGACLPAGGAAGAALGASFGEIEVRPLATDAAAAQPNH